MQSLTVKLLCTMNVALYGGMVTFLQFYVVDGHRRVSVAGGIGGAFALAVFVAPLAIIVNTRYYLPFRLCLILYIISRTY
jgi:solute carrier family 50 (sugar transporter)